ncbi:MAG TPA: hypothetical protein DEW46_18485 [Verrucomicrobia bacterium]|nr:hypothetical protein [Verrucomicrobiota bacterium]
MVSFKLHARVAAAALLAFACTEASIVDAPSDGGASPATDAAHLGDGSLDASLDAGVADAAEDAQDSGPFDGGSDPGWEPLAEPLNRCDFQMAANPAAVEPIVWQDCPGVPSENGCRFMRLDWSDERLRLTDAVSTRLMVESGNQMPVLAFTRRITLGSRPGDCFVIAEADGEVRNAFFLEESPCLDCFPPILFSLKDNQFSLRPAVV